VLRGRNRSVLRLPIALVEGYSTIPLLNLYGKTYNELITSLSAVSVAVGPRSSVVLGFTLRIPTQIPDPFKIELGLVSIER
jgi:hypothetical protein